MIRVRPFLSVAVAVAGVTAWVGQVQAQAPMPSPVNAWEVNIYLQDSERARATAALEQASRGPIGSAVQWTDTATYAAGAIVPVSGSRRADGAECRTYDVVVNVPRRNSLVQRYYGTGSAQNRGVVYYEEPVQLSPAFARRFTAQACRTASGALVPG